MRFFTILNDTFLFRSIAPSKLVGWTTATTATTTTILTSNRATLESAQNIKVKSPCRVAIVNVGNGVP